MTFGKQIFTLSFFAILVSIALSVNLSSLQGSGINRQESPFFSSAEAATTKKSSHFLAGEGKASYYADQFHGHRTANGERFNMHELTAAHPSLPFGTWVRVINLRNGKDVIVRINDRGPFVKGRIIDLSIGAAKELGIIKTGTDKVKLEALGTGRMASIAG